MPKARKLKSGSWNCTVYAGRDETGKRKYKSFTVRDPTRAGKKECERLAAEWSAQHQDTPPGQLTVYEAVRKYIDIKEKVLSPSTIHSYELYLKKRIKPIQDRRIDDLTQQDVQQWINSLATDCTPKYIKNVYGLFSAALAYYETRSYTVTFPSVAPEPTYTPCDDDIALLLGTVRDRPQLLSCVLLAAFGSLRRGEICAAAPGYGRKPRADVQKHGPGCRRLLAHQAHGKDRRIEPHGNPSATSRGHGHASGSASPRAGFKSLPAGRSIQRLRAQVPLPRFETLLRVDRTRPGRPRCLHHADGRLADRSCHASCLSGYIAGRDGKRARQTHPAFYWVVLQNVLHGSRKSSKNARSP